MKRELITGWAKIANGNLAAGLLRLFGLVIAARALGVEALGVIVLIEAYARVIDGLLNFQSVNVMTRFLAELDLVRDRERFRGLVKAGLLVDGATAAGTCLLAVVALPLVGPAVGIPMTWTVPGMVFSLVIASRVLGTAEAILRCLDRYWLIGSREALSGLLMVSASLVAWSQEAGAQVFLMIWMGAEIAANIVFVALVFSALRRNGIVDVWSSNARQAIRESDGFWTMLWQTNMTFGVRILSQYGDLLIAGAVLGQASAGLLRAAKNIASVLSLLGRPLQQVASAPIARLWARGDAQTLIAYTRTICLVAGMVGLVIAGAFAVFGDLPLSLLFGSEFAVAEVTLAILMLANAIYLCGVTLLPTMLTLGLSTPFLLGVLWGTLGYAVVLFASVVPFGNPGIAVAHVAFNVVWAAYGWRRVVKRVREATAHPLQA